MEENLHEENGDQSKAQGRPPLIFAVGRRRNFTIIDNDFLRDSRISYRAKGVLSACLSHGENFEFNREWIESHGTEGRDAIRSALKELREFGYLKNVKKRDSFGRIVGERYQFTDIPAQDSDDSVETEGVSADFQRPGNPAAGFSGRIRRSIEENQENPPIYPRTRKKRRQDGPLELPDWLEPYRAGIELWLTRSREKHRRAEWEVGRRSVEALRHALSLNCVEALLEVAAERKWLSLGFVGYADTIEKLAKEVHARKPGNAKTPTADVTYTLID